MYINRGHPRPDNRPATLSLPWAYLVICHYCPTSPLKMSTTTTITQEQTPESLTLAYKPEIHHEVRLMR
jgi:hypothetical protein